MTELLPKPKLQICGCTYYNGGQCYNCLNGAHHICKDGGCGITAPFVERERDYYKRLAEFAVEALEIYADEGFYHGCAFIFDRPTGGFDEDFSLDEGSNYSYEKPGKLAREALSRIKQTEQL